jgi:hypothetical protein
LWLKLSCEISVARELASMAVMSRAVLKSEEGASDSTSSAADMTVRIKKVKESVEEQK